MTSPLEVGTKLKKNTADIIVIFIITIIAIRLFPLFSSPYCVYFHLLHLLTTFITVLLLLFSSSYPSSASSCSSSISISSYKISFSSSNQQVCEPSDHVDKRLAHSKNKRSPKQCTRFGVVSSHQWFAQGSALTSFFLFHDLHPRSRKSTKICHINICRRHQGEQKFSSPHLIVRPYNIDQIIQGFKNGKCPSSAQIERKIMYLGPIKFNYSYIMQERPVKLVN